MAYIKRAVEDTIARVSRMFPVLLVTGPRQVGKTTLLQRMAEAQQSEGIERKYVTLDDPDVRYLAKHDPALIHILQKKRGLNSPRYFYANLRLIYCL